MPVIALLHLNEGGYPTVPTSVVNSAPGGLAFLNKGSFGGPGGIFWFGGSDEPWGKGLLMQPSDGALSSITSTTAVTLAGDFCIEGFSDKLTGNFWKLLQFSTDGSTTGAMQIRVEMEEVGTDTYKLHLFARVGSADFELVTGNISPAAVAGMASGFHYALTSEGGYLALQCNGSRRALATVATPGPLTGYLDLFGGYERATDFSGGGYGMKVSELRATDGSAVYTGTTYTVPTARFTDPVGGTTSPTTASAAAGIATVSAVGARKAAAATTAAAGIASVNAAGSRRAASAPTAAAGVSTVAAAGARRAATTVSAVAGLAVVSGQGAAKAISAGSASGAATVAAASAQSNAAADATATDGSAMVSAVGSSASLGSSAAVPAAGLATASSQGAARAASAGSAVGTATVSGIGSFASGTATNAVTAVGAAMVSAASASTAMTAGYAQGISFVSAITYMPAARRYPLAGITQSRPLAGRAQTYPLAGQTQTYPLG